MSETDSYQQTLSQTKSNSIAFFEDAIGKMIQESVCRLGERPNDPMPSEQIVSPCSKTPKQQGIVLGEPVIGHCEGCFVGREVGGDDDWAEDPR
jgi:hypothetical protein